MQRELIHGISSRTEHYMDSSLLHADALYAMIEVILCADALYAMTHDVKKSRGGDFNGYLPGCVRHDLAYTVRALRDEKFLS